MWGSHAADLAYILLQQPVRIAVHARELLRNLTLGDRMSHDNKNELDKIRCDAMLMEIR